LTFANLVVFKRLKLVVIFEGRDAARQNLRCKVWQCGIGRHPTAYALPRMPVTLEADMMAKTSSNVEAQRAAAPGRRQVALALQGGGSHGAGACLTAC